MAAVSVTYNAQARKVKSWNIRAGLKNAALSLQGKISDLATSRFAPLIELAIMNPPLVIPALHAIALTKVTMVVCSCPSMRIMAERVRQDQQIDHGRLEDIFGKITENNQELVALFGAQIDQMKATINSFLDVLITDLRSEMGINAVDYELDQHELSHAFMSWLKEADLADLNNPEQIDRLKELLKEKLGLEEEDDDYMAILEGRLSSDPNIAKLASEVADLAKEMGEVFNEKIEDHDKDSDTDSDNDEDDDITPIGAPKGRTQNA
ncbi:MAG: hypothetical protein HQ564_04125 [Candidatus Saganbacteria bacterium]|nr:hypothetical protein [Candidatus Saganbacteria bacterium]